MNTAWKVWDYWERHLESATSDARECTSRGRRRVVVITGASKWHRTAVCTHLAASGAIIVGVARRAEQLEEMRAEVEGVGRHGVRVSDRSQRP